MSESDIRAADPADIWPPEEEEPPDRVADDAPEGDAVEQQQRIVERESDEPQSVPDDVDPADAAEQNRVVDFDEDDYR
jgi:hypothetical protein